MKEIKKTEITHNDLDFVKSYIKDRQTAILVIMFTDIVGFTKITEDYGEKYAFNLRNQHDQLLTSIIEEHNAGKVIKYIGDSVMAVFSEPTKAVEISVLIQEKLKKLNQDSPDMEDILVRIGLHMGQVAVESHIQADIFGRHVNRASRVESLAGAGQVFVSFPVFDSAKGWLQDIEYLGWESHGEYFLKGIEKPAEIYEVFNKLTSKPKAPKKGKKKRLIPSYIFIILFVIIGALGSWGVFNYQKKEVFLFDFVYEDVRLLDGTPLFLDGEAEDNKRELLTEVDKGIHILYYEVSSSVRYYSPIEINRGVNLIKAEFNYASLPRFEFQTKVEKSETVKETFQKEFSYYNKNAELIKDTAQLDLTIEKELNDEIVDYIVSWDISLGGKIIESGSDIMNRNITDDEYYRGEWEVIYSNDIFVFEYRPKISNAWLEIGIQGSWIRL